MNKLIDNKCGECQHIDKSRENQWGHPCKRVIERIDLFKGRNINMNSIDKFRFSPSVFVSANKKACAFFK